jgi:class 3 adenylate cyclase
VEKEGIGVPYALQIGNSAAEDRLEKLIEERLRTGADKEEIDARIWDLFGETWAVMFTDLSGFSRGVAEFGIVHFLQTIYESQRILVPVIDAHDGILLKMEGDSMMVTFRRAVRATACAIDMQRAVKRYNATRAAEEEILLCIGLGYGRMLQIGDHDVFGPEVNAASKLGEDAAEAWEILATDSVKHEVDVLAEVEFESIDTIPPGASGAYRVLYQL